jgi:hypothetical protein
MRFLLVWVTCWACLDKPPPSEEPPAGDGFATVRALGPTTVVVTFTRLLDRSSVTAEGFEAADRTVVPPLALSIVGVTVGDADVILETGIQDPGRTYTLKVHGVRDSSGYALDGTLNFSGGGAQSTAVVSFTVEDAARAAAWGALRLELTVEPVGGFFSDRLHSIEFQVFGDLLRADSSVRVDGKRTADRHDDADPVEDRRGYAARAITVDKVPASPLVLFEVLSHQPMTVGLPLLDPPIPPAIGTEGFDDPVDPAPGDGRKRVRLIVDDRASQELNAPALKLSFNEDGQFDRAFPQTLTLGEPEEPRLYEVAVDVRVDPLRRLDGTDETTLPYIAYLVNDSVDVEAINVSVLAADEVPQAVAVPLGHATMTPVTFRVDAGAAFLTADGAQRGVFLDESVWLTGEWQSAYDALGRNAGDAFTGGEQLTLEMRRSEANDGLWFKTLWLPRGRPYGWKVVRCQSAVGCGPLNQRVSSTGRAFPTVMKNLVTENQDAFAVPSVLVVNPHELAAVPLQTGSEDYTEASVYIGSGIGAEPNPPNVPRPDVLFKQEVPDLAVLVGDQPVVTPVYVVGTWRDVNLPKRPAEILAGQEVIALSPYDYDEGLIGRYPPSRDEP